MNFIITKRIEAKTVQDAIKHETGDILAITQEQPEEPKEQIGFKI